MQKIAELECEVARLKRELVEVREQNLFLTKISSQYQKRFFDLYGVSKHCKKCGEFAREIAG